MNDILDRSVPTVDLVLSHSVSSDNITWVQYTVGCPLNIFFNTCIFLYSSLEERSLVYFSDNTPSLLRAYVDSGEGLDRAGGFAVQVRGHTQRSAS